VTDLDLWGSEVWQLSGELHHRKKIWTLLGAVQGELHNGERIGTHLVIFRENRFVGRKLSSLELVELRGELGRGKENRNHSDLLIFV
jgi:hypothetical protein